jgi:acetyl-CoA C-acetyltransferase
MGSHGIRDQVAIVGMGCTAFGEHWDKSTDDLLIESATAASASAGLELGEIDAFWLGTMGSGVSGLTLSRPLRLQNKPVTRLENMCATGSESLRNACYAVASGAYDCAMAIGVEKLKDSGFSGLVGSNAPGAGDDGKGDTTAPANFSLLAPAYAAKYGVDPAELKDVLTRIAWKNHQNGSKNPRAQFRKEVPKETIAKSPLVAGMLGIFDCSGVSDGSAAAIVVRADPADPPASEELRAFARAALAGFKVPAQWEFVPSLPRNATGKLLRRELRGGSAPDRP